MTDEARIDRFALPADLPAPEDDGAATHLPGTRLPRVGLTSTEGTPVTLAELLGRTVVFAYPKTGDPQRAVPEG